MVRIMDVAAHSLAAGAGIRPEDVLLTVNGNAIELSSEYLALEKRLMLNGKAVDTLQIDNVLVAIEM